MTSPEKSNRVLPQHDYNAALRNAVSWLGDRYLLADPVRCRKDERRPFFTTTRGWHPKTSPNH